MSSGFGQMEGPGALRIGYGVPVTDMRGIEDGLSDIERKLDEVLALLNKED